MTDSTGCVLHVDHSPVPEQMEHHHVFPIGWGGSKDGEIVLICPTGHMNVHELLRAMYHAGGDVDWETRKHYGTHTQHLAQRGYTAWVEAGRPQVRMIDPKAGDADATS